MALTVSHIEANFAKDTKMIGKQSAYLDFDFGGCVHSTDVLKSAGKFATWDTPVQLTGAGVNMKVIAKASKTLASDKPLGVGELNLLNAAGQGPQTVQLRTEGTGEYAGEVRLTISGGSPAISGLPHTEGHGLASAVPGHHSSEQGHHSGTGAGALGGAAAGAGAGGLGGAALHSHNQGQQPGTGLSNNQTAGYSSGVQQGTSGLGSRQNTGGQAYSSGTQQGTSGLGQQAGHGNNNALGGAAAGAGAAGLGAAALHHHNQQDNQQGAVYGGEHCQGGLSSVPPPSGRQHESLGQRVKEALPGHHNTNTGTQGVTGGQQGYSSGQQGIGSGIGSMSSSSGQTGALHMGGGSTGGIGQQTGGIGQQPGGGNHHVGTGGISHVHGAGGPTCPECHGTGNLAQRVEQGLGLGSGNTAQQQGRPAY